MNHKTKMAVFIGLIVLAIIITYFAFSENTNHNKASTVNAGTSYDANSEIEDALKVLKKGTKSASLIKDVNTVEKVTAITFEGMVDHTTVKDLLKLLDSYQVKSTFFLPGIKSAEDPDTAKAISDSGQDIGSYTLSEDKSMEKFSQRELVENFGRTNVILNEICGKKPLLFKCNLTEYTDNLLKAANASGLKAAIKNNYFLNYQSFSSEENASGFVKGMSRGSIISIKVDSVLDEAEYDSGKEIKEEKSAVDTKNVAEREKLSINTKDKAEIDKNKKLLEVVSYLLDALQKEKYKIIPLDELSSYNDTDFTKSFESERNKNKGDLAEIFKKVNTKLSSVAYSFRGIENEGNLDKVLDFLKENNIKATFFVTGNEIIEFPDRIRKILDAGQLIGNGGLTGTPLEEMSYREVCFEIYKCDKLLKEKYQVSTNLFMPVYGKYNNTVLEAAASLNYLVVTYSRIPVLDGADTPDGGINQLANGYSDGDILYFGLDYKNILKEVEMVTSHRKKQAGNDILPIATLISNSLVSNKPDKSDTIVENTLKIDTTPGNYKARRILNSGNKADLVTKLYTSEPAVAYIFRGISNRENLNSVLQTLDTLNAKATFFVTGKEIINCKANVDEIVRRGHQICNGGYGVNYSNPGKRDFNDICYDIDMGERCLKAYLGSSYDEETNKYYMPLYADTTGALLEAAKTLGYSKVITYNISAMSKTYRDLSANQIINKYFANTIALQRGDIVYFRLDYLTQKDAVSSLVYQTAENFIKKAPYDISTVADMFNSSLVYILAARTQATGSNLVKESFNFSKETLLSSIFTKYIGNPYIRTNKELIGFSDNEISNIDKSGRIKTNGKKVLFLTFDDWGYDDNITRLLNVLKKYNVKATFFVRVGNGNLSYDSSMTNPNLLRAIAMDGHDIGNHTFRHMKVNIKTENESKLLSKDIVTANQEMARYIGDTGSLKLFFRPPTLEVSKLGLETIFDSGFKYVINGDFSTHDYEAKSAQKLINKLINGINTKGPDQEVTSTTPQDDILKIGPGSIVVMHMSEDAVYTPEALDTVIPYYLNQGYQFARLSDYLK